MEPKDDIYNGYINLTDYNHMKDAMQTTGTGQGLWNQITSSTTFNSPIDPAEDKLIEMEKKMNALDLKYSLLKLKILSSQGMFTQEEISNIRKMLMSEDEASRTLADTIIENA